MGRQDGHEKRELEQALTAAWNLWAKHSVDSRLSPIMHKHLPSHMSDSEVEEDSETIEEDRHMATNDDTNDESAVLKCDIKLSRSILDTTMAQGKKRIFMLYCSGVSMAGPRRAQPLPDRDNAYLLVVGLKNGISLETPAPVNV